MKRLYVAAALLMATTAAHAGNSVSFEIEGHRIHIEAPKNCNSLSCIHISGPGISGSGFNLKGLKGFNNSDDDDDVADNSNPPPVQKTAPRARRPGTSAAARSHRLSTTLRPSRPQWHPPRPLLPRRS